MIIGTNIFLLDYFFLNQFLNGLIHLSLLELSNIIFWDLKVGQQTVYSPEPGQTAQIAKTKHFGPSRIQFNIIIIQKKVSVAKKLCKTVTLIELRIFWIYPSKSQGTSITLQNCTINSKHISIECEFSFITRLLMMNTQIPFVDSLLDIY